MVSMQEKIIALKKLFNEIMEIESLLIELCLPFEIIRNIYLRIAEILLKILQLGKYDFEKNNWWKK